MAKLSELRKQAKILGIPASEIRSADTLSDLQALIDSANGTASKPRKKVAVRRAVRKSSGTRKVAARKSASSKATPARSRKSGTAKRSSTAKTRTMRRTSTAKARTTSTAKKAADSGRNLLNGVDFTQTDGWNARDDSAPDRIIRCLRKFRGNREKAFDALVGDVWDFVGKKMRDGSKRTKSDAEAMLRYRISRTAWDFAKATGQHDPATNRAEYGTAGTGMGTWKPAKKASTTKASTRKSTARKSTAARKSAPRKQTAARKTTARGRKTKTASARKR